MKLFRDKRVAARIETIKVTAEAVNHAEPWVLPLEFGYFVDHALSEAMYEADELPREAVLGADLHTFIGEWNNGGYAGFTGNIANAEECARDVARMLDLLGLSAQQRVTGAFVRFAKDHPDRFKRFHGEYDDIDPYFFDLDDQLHALGGCRPITLELREWLRTRDWLEVLDDGRPFTANRLSEWIPDHPEHARRKGNRRYAFPDHLRDSLETYRAWLKPKH